MVSDESNLVQPKWKEEKPSNGFINVILNNDKNKPIHFLEEKCAADASDRICPMCHTTYKSDCLFEEFQEHVESHFIKDDTDLSIDTDRFEFISNTVGNF